MERATVKHDYVATDDGELSISKGETLDILEKDDDWWKCRAPARNLVGYW